MTSLLQHTVLAVALLFSELGETQSGNFIDACTIGQRQLQDQTEGSYVDNPDYGVYIDTSHPATCNGTVTSITVYGRVLQEQAQSHFAQVVLGRISFENTEIHLSMSYQIPCSTTRASPELRVCTIQGFDLSIQEGDLLGVVLSSCPSGRKCSVSPVLNIDGLESSLSLTANLSTITPYSELVTRPSLSLNIETTIDQVTTPEMDITTLGAFFEIGFIDENANETNFVFESGLFIIPDESEVEGSLESVEACGIIAPSHRTDSPILEFTLIQLRLTTLLVRNATVRLAKQNGSTLFCAKEDNLDWDVEAHDYFGVVTAEDCTNGICPAQIILPTEGFQLIHNPTLDYLNIDLATISSLDILSSRRANMRLRIAFPLATDPTVATRAKDALLESGIGIGVVSTFVFFGLLITGIVLTAVCIKMKRKRASYNVKSKTWTRPQPIQVNESGRLRRTQSRKSRNQAHLKSPLQRMISNLNDYSTITESLGYERTDVLVSSEYETPFQSNEYEDPVFSPASQEQELKQQLLGLGVQEIPLDQLQFEAELGKGQFAKVYKALWDGTLTYSDSEPIAVSAHVAVKVMEDQSTVEDRVNFLQEAVLLGQFDDPNIVAIFGVITDTIKLMLVCELMDEDLRRHLIRIRTCIESGQPTNEMQPVRPCELPGLLLSYCRKIASSFVYLGLKGFIHRDLAARNILISKEGDCKLSDFGLSRELLDDSYYKSQGGLIPVKWTAPEAILYKRYSMKSDVWSYGILLFEMWSLGHKPYLNISNMEVIRKVEKGYRLPPPPGCPRTIYDLIIKCTHPQPEARPSFANILTSLQKPDYQLLKWMPEDVAANSEEARKLGSPLEEGEMLYEELQNTYIDSTAETNF